MSSRKGFLKTRTVFSIISFLLCASSQAFFKSYVSGDHQGIIQVPQSFVNENCDSLEKLCPFAANDGTITLSKERPQQIKSVFESLLDCEIQVKEKIPEVLTYKIKEFVDKPNKNHWNSRKGQPIRFVVGHGTAAPFLSTLLLFTKDIDRDRVSAHYVISCPETVAFRDTGLRLNVPGGVLFKIGSEKDRLWHAGASYWRGFSDLNSCSIGIELTNSTHDTSDGTRVLYDFDNSTLETFSLLATSLKNKYNLQSSDFIYHADVSFEIKEDPWHQFPYQRLYELGVGLGLDFRVMETLTKPSDRIVQLVGEKLNKFYTLLSKIGYKYTENMDHESLRYLTMAFQQHFTCSGDPKFLTGFPTQFDFVIASALVEKYRQRDEVKAKF